MVWYVLAVAIFLVVALAVKKIGERNAGPVDFPYRKKDLFSPAERSFLGVLSQSIGDSGQIFGKVRVADVVAPTKNLSRTSWQKAFNRISRKHFDFVVCTKTDMAVLCAVELNDSSHNRANRQKRDSFLAGVCEAAGIPLISISAKRSYTIGEIKDLLAPHVFGESLPDHKVCPLCGSPMVKRTARKAKNAEGKFWGCSGFPNCRHTEALVIETEPLPLEHTKENIS